MCDKLVFDLSQEVEGSPNVFIRKDWINILDNMNQNYQNNQCIIDTSQLANSNKYMAYREAYLAMPLYGVVIGPSEDNFNGTATTPSDYSFGLKNWFGSMIHSFTLDYNGTTIIQQTPYINMWNMFKLLTSLSYQDVKTMGATIGFYPDTPGSVTVQNLYSQTLGAGLNGSPFGLGVCNNSSGFISPITTTSFVSPVTLPGALVDGSGNTLDQKIQIQAATAVANVSCGIIPAGGNVGLTQRTRWIAYDDASTAGVYGTAGNPVNALTYGQAFMNRDSASTVWKSNVTFAQASAGAARGFKTFSIMAVIYLRHIHSFFNMCPLLKGVFMKLTMNLNNTTVQTTLACPDGAGGVGRSKFLSYTTSNPVGGVCPILIPAIESVNNRFYAGNGYLQNPELVAATDAIPVSYGLYVGSQCLDPVMAAIIGNRVGNISKSVYLYVPAYTFNPPFEQAYLSNSVKQIKYTDVYQYQYQTVVEPGSPFNFLVTNGISNIKSVLIIPFVKRSATSATAAIGDYLEFQSPFDTAGCGTTAPFVSLNNFNVQISGQNAIYNTQRYTYEEFVNQLYGQNAVNGGMTDGLSSSLIDYHAFQTSYCYYYVNVERMLPVEQSVPKSVQIIGVNATQSTAIANTSIYSSALQFWVFIEYGVEVKIDVLTGARV